MIYFGEVPSVYQLDTIRHLVGPELASRVHAQNSAAVTGRAVLDPKPEDGPRFTEYFARLIEDKKPPADGWFDVFTLLEYPSAFLAKLAEKRKPVLSGPNTTRYSEGNVVLVHERVAADTVRRPLNVEA